MKRLQAFKFELQPTGEQRRCMGRFSGSGRFVFNRALSLQKERYEKGEKKLNYAGLCRLLTEWRNTPDSIWLAATPVHPLQQKLKDLEKAYGNFFAKRADFPRFKKKGQGDGFRYPDQKQFKIDQPNRRLFLPKLGWIRYRNSRELLGTAKNITISQSNGKWFASIQTEREVEISHTKGSEIGIDVGIARFATLSGTCQSILHKNWFSFSEVIISNSGFSASFIGLLIHTSLSGTATFGGPFTNRSGCAA